MREGLVQLLGSAERLQVVGSAGEANEAAKLISALKPDIVLMDLMLGGGDSLQLIAELTRQHPGLKVLVFSMMNEAVFAERSLRAGALGYVMKSVKLAELLQAIQTVIEGKVYLSPKISVSLFRGLLQRSTTGQVPGAEGLSDRELQVFQMIGAGLPNRQIALHLGISVKTIETHRENLKLKLGITDATELSKAAQTFVSSLIA